MNRLLSTAAKGTAILGLFAVNAMNTSVAQNTASSEKATLPNITHMQRMKNVGTTSGADNGKDKGSLVLVLDTDTVVVTPDPKGDAHFAFGHRGIDKNGKLNGEMWLHRNNDMFFMQSAKTFHLIENLMVSLEPYNQKMHGSVAWKMTPPHKKNQIRTVRASYQPEEADQDTLNQKPSPKSEELFAVGFALQPQPLLPQDTTETGQPLRRLNSHLLIITAQKDTLIVEEHEDGTHVMVSGFDTEGDNGFHLWDKDGNQQYKGNPRPLLNFYSNKVNMVRYDAKEHGEIILLQEFKRKEEDDYDYNGPVPGSVRSASGLSI